ncbi:hypothetical protein E3N88_38187 [Mikania micrantha]|uniref:Uncharacterized protein n=1 Tax=Mikania micrantha TaxID=192012 RepID=A0A5N6LTJ7_9ASTR|nr:hypothetical protein E3N88_38187 [Mikania micrantha]
MSSHSADRSASVPRNKSKEFIAVPEEESDRPPRIETESEKAYWAEAEAIPPQPDIPFSQLRSSDFSRHNTSYWGGSIHWSVLRNYHFPSSFEFIVGGEQKSRVYRPLSTWEYEIELEKEELKSDAESPYHPPEASLPSISPPELQPKASNASTKPKISKPKAPRRPTSPTSSCESRIGPESTIVEPPPKIRRISQGARLPPPREGRVFARKLAHTIGSCSWGTHEESDD